MKEHSSLFLSALSFSETQMQRQLTELRLTAFREHYQALASEASQSNAAYGQYLGIQQGRQHGIHPADHIPEGRKAERHHDHATGLGTKTL